MPVSAKDLDRREDDVCELSYVDQDRVRRVAKALPSP